ncbi:hypothetical protein [Noviherbaspirillum aerium]|uniref:hypothetical protein n=1 Tax=Noviherbaspirillum aerium TaxID=2588497 RepID=UPI00124EAA91|nr:hypothetical protein [Noviherbaspirillum aerium]
MRLGSRIMAMLLMPVVPAYASALPDPVKAEAQKLYGIEYTPQLMGELIAPGISQCTYQGGGTLQLDGVDRSDWAKDYVHCNNHVVILLSKKVGESRGYDLWRTVDVLPLPKLDLQRNRRQPNKLVLYSSFEGLCSVQGRYGMDFIALLQWGKRDRIDWQTGVKQAWTFDIRQERIVPLPTRDIRCKWDEP